MEEADLSTDFDKDLELLVTRAGEYSKESNSVSTPTQPKPKNSARNSAFLKCEEHDTSKTWTDINSSCSKCIIYSLGCDNLPNGILPRGKDVLSYLLTLKRMNSGKSWINSEHNCAMDLVLHWIYCNVYTISVAATKSRIIEMFKLYEGLKKQPKSKRGPTHWGRLAKFVKSQNELFNIKGRNYNI